MGSRKKNITPKLDSKFPTAALLDVDKEDRVKGLTGRIKHFSPSWFSVTMGTGIPCTLILNLPYPEAVHYLRVPATIFLVLDTILFAGFTITIATRYIRFPEIWRLTWTHESHSLYIGTIPMSLFTLISGWMGISQTYGWGESWLWAMSVCWWLSCVVSIAVAFTVPFLAFTTHRNLPETMTAALLLPVVPNITAAAIGAVLASHFVDISPSYSMHIWIASYVLLGPGILTALFYLTLYLQRLHFHHIPPNETIVSSFLPLGPCGLGGFSSLKLGTVAVRLFPLIEGGPTMQAIGNNGRQMAGWTLWGAGLIFALMLWGLGIWFMFIAVSSFAHRWKEGTLRFNMGWWGFTFPLASLTLSTLLIGSELDSKGFQVVGTVFTLMIIILWTFVSIPTIKGACSGSKIIFAAPCLSALEHSDGKGKSPEETIQADERNPSPSSTASGSVSEKTK